MWIVKVWNSREFKLEWIAIGDCFIRLISDQSCIQFQSEILNKDESVSNHLQAVSKANASKKFNIVFQQ